MPFKYYLTTNFDRLLYTSALRSGKNPRIRVHPDLDRAHTVEGSIHYLHGFIVENKKPVENQIVLSRNEFMKAYENNGNLKTFLIPTFKNESILFIGCELREPQMKEIFGICKLQQDMQQQLMSLMEAKLIENPTNYILRSKLPNSTGIGLSEEQIKQKMQTEDEYYESFGIKTIWYENPGENHIELWKTLDRIAGIQEPSPYQQLRRD